MANAVTARTGATAVAVVALTVVIVGSADRPEPAACEGAEVDPWVTELRDRVLSLNAMAHFAAETFGSHVGCEGAVTIEFDGAKFGLVRLSFADGVGLEVETMPPAVSLVTLSHAVGFEDAEPVRAAFVSFVDGHGVDVDWDAATIETEGDARVETYSDPEPGLNAMAVLTYRGDALVSVRFSMAL